LSGRVILNGDTLHVADALAISETEFPGSRAAIERQGIRTALGVPLMRGETALGAIALRRMTVRPFTDKQIELVQNCAAQAVIAMENAGLLNERRDSCQQQPAPADVLKLISRPTFDLGSVLRALVETATRLCEADKGAITRQRDGMFYRAESY